MADSKRILFISSEVTPFAQLSGMAEVIRKIPEYLTNDGQFEARILMPRYGTVSERKNRLHEVIRLSGSEISVGDDGDTLHVKVASIPGIRLQVYFMDSLKYFKRKGIYTDLKTGEDFTDQIERAVFFAKSAIETTKNLGWEPKVVYTHGWLTSLIPLLLKTKYAADPLFDDCKLIYSRDGFDPDLKMTQEEALSYDIGDDSRLWKSTLPKIAESYSDALAYGAGFRSPGRGATKIVGDDAQMAEIAHELFAEVLGVAPSVAA